VAAAGAPENGRSPAPNGRRLVHRPQLDDELPVEPVVAGLLAEDPLPDDVLPDVEPPEDDESAFVDEAPLEPDDEPPSLEVEAPALVPLFSVDPLELDPLDDFALERLSVR
jgi:hypothetical protein